MDGVAQEFGVPFETADSAASRGADDRAFAALVDRHAGLMYRVAYSLLKQPQDAEDAVQETLLKLYRTGGWRQMEDEKAFLAKSVWRVGLNRLGTLGAKAMRHAEDVAGMNLASAGASPEEHALGAGERALMMRLIEELPEGFRQALVLSAIEGMRSQEVAAVLGIPEATVRTRVLRAKAEMRRRFMEMNAAKEGRR
jgi:RNA polymerase sigma-70 factor, ECF subfamily